ncbi:MAG: DUF309 domain-containing protein [bacterium]|nr:DUF309 domain-containing protein [bacterium]
MPPAFPLPLRNALAALAVEAATDDVACAALVWLTAPHATPPAEVAARLAAGHLVDPGSAALLDVHAPWADAVATHAHRAARAAAARRARPSSPGAGAVDRALDDAAALWAEGLFFEVHEVLEAAWQPLTGDARHGLQGVIQIAVAFHHLRHGNARGARNLLRDGSERLHGAADALPHLDAPALLAGLGPWQVALESGAEPPATPPPPLTLR